MAAKRVRDGIDTPYVCISYGGQPEVVRSLPGYADLAEAASKHGAEVLISPMSTTAAVNVGPGALSLAFAASGHRPN